MDSIFSKDGTRIAYFRSGTGPPLVLVHGTLGFSRGWPILSVLERQFTVYAVDRRGRGESGDHSSYAIEREFEDIAALVEVIGGGVHLLGHSFGGLVALEAAALAPHLIRSLILYEPPLPVPGIQLYPDGSINRLEALLDAGDRENVVLTLLTEVVGMPAEELELLRNSPAFPRMVAATHTVPRESRAEETYEFKPDRFRSLIVPTLLLLGGDSPDYFKATTQALHSVLTNSRVAVFPGQQHIAHYTAPEMFAREVQAFLREPDQQTIAGEPQ